MRIALVEPPREAQDSIASLLGRQGHEVLSFPDANEALKELKSDPAIDALIAGAQAGSISGAELCREARRVANDAKRPLYVLLMSSDTDPAARAEAFDYCVDGIIAEPPPPDELREKLHVAQRMIALERELMQLARTDRLTGALTRSAFFDEITAECTRATNGDALAMIVFDIDSFRAINDHYGHAVGDRVLRALADVAREFGAPVGRLSGDALSILLKDHALAQALKVAEEMHRKLDQVKLETADGVLSLTCSLGVGDFHVGDSVDDLIKRADLALYRAKNEGRDCVRTTPRESWMSQRPRLGVSLARLLGAPSPVVKERRNGSPPGDALYARVYAIIDLLVVAGLSEEVAAQIMTQRLTTAGISAPVDSDAKEWWQYILDRRAGFRAGNATEEALKEYRNVVAAIETIAPHERVECALANDIWDRRRMAVGQRSSAHRLLVP